MSRVVVGLGRGAHAADRLRLVAREVDEDRAAALAVLALALAAVLATSPFLEGCVFTFIQEFQGYVAGKRTVLKRLGQPEDIARAALFFTSDDAARVTGTTLTVDGGIMTGA